MPTDPTTLEQFSDRQPLPGASGNSLLANLDGAPVRLRRLPLTPDAVTAARQQLAAAAGISHPAIVPDSGLLVQDGEVWVWRPELEGEAPVSDDQEQRLANERLFVSLVQQSPEGICITDVNGHCEWVNEAFEKLTGVSANEMHGQKPGQLLQGPETDPETVARIALALE